MDTYNLTERLDLFLCHPWAQGAPRSGALGKRLCGFLSSSGLLGPLSAFRSLCFLQNGRQILSGPFEPALGRRGLSKLDTGYR